MLQGSTWAAAASAFLGAAQALTLNVGADGVNKTSPIHYGTLYEVCKHHLQFELVPSLTTTLGCLPLW